MHTAEKTNWNLYYDKKSKLSSLTQRITQKKLINLIEKYCGNSQIRIIELGGANSCFAQALTENFDVAKYTIVDNSDVGITKFKRTWQHQSVCTSAIKCDLLSEKMEECAYDLCYSVGLIEHFDEDGTKKIISQHFSCVKNNAIVILSFPTPTLQYRFIRKLMELFGLWRFPDERPLLLDEVCSTLKKYGQIEESYLNCKLPLSQYICVVRKN